MAVGAGKLKEQIDILSPTPVARVITSITRVGSVATVTTATAHAFETGFFVTLSGVTPAAYDGEVQVTVTSPTVFTFAVAGSPDSPATVPGSVVFVSDAQGGGGSGVFTLATGVFANIEPLSAGEQLASGGIAAIGFYKTKIYYRADVTPVMKILWRKYLEPAAKTYEIHSVQPADGEGRRLLQIEMGVVE